jgi:hypothetical protein
MESDLQKIEDLKKDMNIIRETVAKCRTEGKDGFDIEMHVMTELPELYEQYPFLIKRLSKSTDDSYLDKFLKAIVEVSNGEKSLAAVELNLGLELKKKFIDSVLDKKK